MSISLTYCRQVFYRKTFQNLLKCNSSPKYRVISLHEVLKFSTNSRNKLVLGIETSCDDTGAAVVDDERNVLGDALNSQVKVHTDYGGIVLPHAQALHRENIQPIVTEALAKAKVTLQDLDAIAVTVKPGLALSLGIGLEYAKELVKQSSKPMIPIHHMEAHALTVRLLQKVDFPYMVFLLSGGHCLLSVARDIDDFLLLGTTIDSAPGNCLDKVARGLNLRKLPECDGLSGGASIELVARKGDPRSFPMPHLLASNRNCDFSFSGLTSHFNRLTQAEQIRQGLTEDDVLSNVADICASCQYAVLRSLCRKLQRAFIYCEVKGLLPEPRVLVAAGGVASNMYIRQGLTKLCAMFSCQLICPPPYLCTDNGIMIAWNGMEKLLAGKGIAEDPLSLQYSPKVPFGEDIRSDVVKSNIKLPKLKLEI